MQAQLEELKQKVEMDLGRPMDVAEEIETKVLFYFAKGVELANQLEAEDMGGPVHIKETLPGTMTNIRNRMGRDHKRDRQSRIIEATRDFLAGNRKRPRQSKSQPSRECSKVLKRSHE